MSIKKMTPLFRGLSAACGSVLVLTTIGSTIIESYRAYLDNFLGTTSYVTNTDSEDARFVSDYDTIEDLASAAKDIAIREGEEGTVIMKNDNNVLPLSEGKQIALFGLAAYAPYPYASGDLKGGNEDAVDLVGAFEQAGYTVNSTLYDFYTKMMNRHEEETENQWTGALETHVVYDVIYNTAVGDMGDFQIVEVTPSMYSDYGISDDWESSIDHDNTTGVVVFSRAGGETTTYGTDTAVNMAGESTGEDPLKLSEDELALVDKAKELCGSVVVLLNTGNAMLISDIAEGGEHEVDGIAYIGCPNDYQCTGIVNVLTGAVNSTGALPETYVADNASNPAVMNFGGDYYADSDIVAANSENGYDDRYPKTDISNVSSAGSFGGGDATYSAGQYIVEAEGIYVGYKYYETRYYDMVVNPDSNASSTKGSTTGNAWNYDDEVVYSFGHSISYLDYSQEIKSIDIDKTGEGNVTAVIAVTNNSSTDGKFLAQLYVQQPYTEYDKENNVEKSAVMFLNSAKVEVAAGQTQEVTITVPTKYLASYDYTTAKTYIFDEGDYIFTAASGSHEAINNILASQGYTTENGMDAEAEGNTVVWTNNTGLDTTTFALSNNTVVTNVADTADLNYWTGEDTVTYLSRNDWDATYPINYNEDVEIKISDSPLADEWIAQLRGQQHVITTDNEATEGTDLGLRFGSSDMTYDVVSDINNEYWDKLVSEITIDEAVGAVIHGGSQSDTLTNVENPIVSQNEGVNGFTAGYTDEETGKTYQFNISSQTLLGSSFNPELAYEWGLVEGNSGLWLQRYVIWGTGLTLRRTPYNGRNYEYISEDAMLTNRIGYGIIKGCTEKGIMNGPKHLGFNDQEHNRNGVAAYMNEQKFRETDLRGFQGALEDAGGMAVMIAFNRIGPVNASHSTALLTDILRNEWGFTGIISTDMMNNGYYFSPESMVMAGITMVADFGSNDNHINLGDGGVDATWAYISEDSVSKDAELVEAARQNLKYQLYTFANSAVLNVSTTRVNTWYDNALNLTNKLSLVLLIVCAAMYVVSVLVPEARKEEK